MSKRKWTIRTYNAFIRTIRKQYNIHLQAARTIYRVMRQKLGRSLYSTDVKRHPRITKDVTASVIKKRVPVFKRPPTEIPIAEPEWTEYAWRAYETREKRPPKKRRIPRYQKAFIREVRKKYNISAKTARAVYKAMQQRLRRQPYGIDVKRHPRITKSVVLSLMERAERRAYETRKKRSSAHRH